MNLLRRKYQWISGLLVISLVVLITTLSVNPCVAQSDVVESNLGHRSLLLCCGLVGDDQHRETMTAAVRGIQSSAEAVFGVTTKNQHVLVADDVMQQDLQDVVSVKGICTSEAVKAHVKLLCTSLTEDDSVLIIFIGHSHLNRSASQFNVMDRDFDQSDFAKWTKPLMCKEQIFILTQPLSGFWVRPLRKLGRIVIAATEADLEFTGTEMPYALAAILSGESQHSDLSDIDGDGQVSLLDLYLATNLEIDGRFTAMERLITEHAQLDDNGDGRGSELQTPYMPIEETEDDVDDSIGEEKQDEEESDKSESVDGIPEGTEVDDNASKVESQQSQSSSDSDTETTPATANLPKRGANIIRSENLDGYRSRLIPLNPPSGNKASETNVERQQ